MIARISIGLFRLQLGVCVDNPHVLKFLMHLRCGASFARAKAEVL